MIEVVDLGRTDFDAADRVQKEALAAGIDRVVVSELDSVITLGRGTPAGAVLDARFPVREVERGGEATLHLPGQVVVYPVFGLEGPGRDLHRWLRRIEAIVIAVLADFGIEGRRREGLTGVWTDRGKVASIGVAVRRWRSYHGFALNVDPDLDAFRAIRPCGLDPEAMTSMARHLDPAPDLAAVKARAIARTLEELSPCSARTP